MGYGDEILAAGQAQRLYDRDSARRIAICDRHHRPRWHPIWDGNPILAPPESVAAGEAVQRLISAPNARPYIVYPFTEETGWTFNRSFRARDHIARIYLTPTEQAVGLDALDRYGPFVLIEPWSKHENLRWPLSHWDALLAALPHVTFVQHVHTHSPLLSAPNLHHIWTSFREACGLVAASRGYVRGESGMLHAAAALGAQSVALWGGCMDWEVLGGYPGQVGVGIAEPACGSWKPCFHCQKTMAAITVTDVIAGLRAIGVE